MIILIKDDHWKICYTTFLLLWIFWILPNHWSTYSIPLLNYWCILSLLHSFINRAVPCIMGERGEQSGVSRARLNWTMRIHLFIKSYIYPLSCFPLALYSGSRAPIFCVPIDFASHSGSNSLLFSLLRPSWERTIPRRLFCRRTGKFKGLLHFLLFFFHQYWY